MSNNAYRVLMEKSLLAHECFHETWAKDPNKESNEVCEARNKFLRANDELWNKLLEPLQQKFNANSSLAIDEVIDFLEVDIPAYRCGYLKEHFLERLKANDLTNTQKERLQNIVLQLCEKNTVRREFRRWVNLMRQVTDEGFVNRLQKLQSTSNENRATKLMLDGLSKDLKRTIS